MEGSRPQQQINVTNILLPHQQNVEDQVIVVKRSTAWSPGSTTNVCGNTGSRPANLIQEQGSPVTELQKIISNLYIEKISMHSQVQQLQVSAQVPMSQDSFQTSKTSTKMTTYEACNILSSESTNSSQVQVEKTSTANEFGLQHYHQQLSLEQLHKQQQILLQKEQMQLLPQYILLQKELLRLLQQYMQLVRQGRLLGQVQTGNASSVNESQQGPQLLQHVLQQMKLEQQLNQLVRELLDQLTLQSKVQAENASTANESPQQHYHQQQSLKYQHQQLLNKQMQLFEQMQLFGQLMEQVQQLMWQMRHGCLLGQVQTENASTVNESQQGPQRLQQMKLELQLHQLELELHHLELEILDQLELQQSLVKTENASIAKEASQHYQQQSMEQQILLQKELLMQQVQQGYLTGHVQTENASIVNESQQGPQQLQCMQQMKKQNLFSPLQPIYPGTKFIMQQPQDPNHLAEGKVVATTTINSIVNASQQPVKLLNNQKHSPTSISITANWTEISTGKVESPGCLKKKREAFTSPYWRDLGGNNNVNRSLLSDRKGQCNFYQSNFRTSAIKGRNYATCVSGSLPRSPNCSWAPSGQ